MSAAELPPDEFATFAPEPYRRLRQLGKGASATVWEAETPEGKRVALKCLTRHKDEPACQREWEALQLVKNLGHPFLLEIHHFWYEDGYLRIVQQLADGTIRGVRSDTAPGQPGSLPVSELVRHIEDAAAAVDFMHDKNVLHRDIKPENLLLLGGRIKVADFGLARENPAEPNLEMSMCGTPPYMAPEVWQNKASRHSDQYSLAVTYVELRQGRRPIVAANLDDYCKKHLLNQLDLEGLYSPEQEVIRKALALKPEERYRNCTAFAAALKTALETTLTTINPPPPPPPPVLRGRAKYLIGLAVLVGLLLGVWLAWLLFQPLPRRPLAVFEAILQDVRNRPEKDVPNLRYFSINHIPAENRDAHRRALQETLNGCLKQPGQVTVRALDGPEPSLFAVDLRDLGWDKPLIQDADRVGTLFDLILLEYPYAICPHDSDTFQELAERFLVRTNSIRPVVWIRADWFVSALNQSPLREEFGSAQALADQSASLQVVQAYRDEPVDLARAARELSLPSSDRLQSLCLQPNLEELAPLAGGASVTRTVWERYQDAVVRGLELGVPIVPLDGLTWLEHRSGAISGVTLKTNKTVFTPKEALFILVNNEAQSSRFIELVGTDRKFDMSPLSRAALNQQNESEVSCLCPGQTYRFPAEQGIEPGLPGKATITLFASTTEFPPGRAFRLAGKRDRFIHDFYPLSRTGGRLRVVDPAPLQKSALSYVVK